MSENVYPIIELLEQDQRYDIEAYQFVREALAYAQETLKMPAQKTAEEGGAEHHITGQQLCEAIRRFAVEQYGFMANLVLASWGISCTGDFGEIVYNLIRIKQMKKSEADRREDFDNVYDFEHAFDPVFELGNNEDA